MGKGGLSDMYSNHERDVLIKKLEGYVKQMNEVQGLLLVGSGATGFKDAYSDVDLLVVVEHKKDVSLMNEKLLDFIRIEFTVLKEKVYQHEEDIFVTCFFFDDYLELDLGVWSFEKLRATKSNWIVLFDRKMDVIDKKLAESLQSDFPTVNEVIDDSTSFIWQFFRSAAVAIKRKRYIKALQDIDFIRNQMIRIICVKHGYHYDYFKVIDEINDPLLYKLKKTYEVTINEQSITQTLLDSASLYFSIIESENKEKAITYQNMIDLFLKELL